MFCLRVGFFPQSFMATGYVWAATDQTLFDLNFFFYIVERRGGSLDVEVFFLSRFRVLQQVKSTDIISSRCSNSISWYEKFSETSWNTIFNTRSTFDLVASIQLMARRVSLVLWSVTALRKLTILAGIKWNCFPWFALRIPFSPPQGARGLLVAFCFAGVPDVALWFCCYMLIAAWSSIMLTRTVGGCALGRGGGEEECCCALVGGFPEQALQNFPSEKYFPCWMKYYINT